MSREFTPQGASCSCTSNTYTINDKPIGRVGSVRSSPVMISMMSPFLLSQMSVT